MQNYLYMAAGVRTAFDNFKATLEPLLARSELVQPDKAGLLVRLERYFQDFFDSFRRLYAQHPDYKTQLDHIAKILVDACYQRAADMKLLDLEREITPDWFQRENMVGYISYVDLFAGTLNGVTKNL